MTLRHGVHDVRGDVQVECRGAHLRAESLRVDVGHGTVRFVATIPGRHTSFQVPAAVFVLGEFGYLVGVTYKVDVVRLGVTKRDVTRVYAALPQVLPCEGK